jgi:hypothetical protein
MNVRLRRHAQDIGHGHPFPALESTANGGFGCGENEKWRSHQETPRYRAPVDVRAMRRRMKIRGTERNEFTLGGGAAEPDLFSARSAICWDTAAYHRGFRNGCPCFAAAG